MKTHSYIVVNVRILLVKVFRDNTVFASIVLANGSCLLLIMI